MVAWELLRLCRRLSGQCYIVGNGLWMVAMEFLRCCGCSHPSSLIERVVKLRLHGDLAVGMRIHQRKSQV